jgi:hypothetical protein
MKKELQSSTMERRLAAERLQKLAGNNQQPQLATKPETKSKRRLQATQPALVTA